MKLYIIIILCALTLGANAQTTLTQEQCRDMALAHNEKLQQADNAVEQARIDRQIADIAALPRLDGMAMGVYGAPDTDLMGIKLQMRGTYLAGINLTLPIYVGGKITTAKRLATIGEQAAREQRRLTRTEVICESDNVFFSYVAVLEKQKMMQAYMKQMDTLVSQTAAALKVGMATDNDLLRIEARRSEIVYQQQKVANGVELCRLALCNVTGIDLSEKIIVETEDLDGQSNLSESSQNLRPELRLLENQIEADRLQIRMARADMLPTVALSGGYTYYGNLRLKGTDTSGNSFSQEYRDGTAMAMLTVKIPIFHWGETSKKVKKARLSFRNSELELQRTARLLSIEMEQARCNLHDARSMVSSAECALSQAEENLRVMRNRYAQSMSPLTDLLDAQSEWLKARSNLIEAKAQTKIDETDYMRAMGLL